jgi:hypothetical protein
MIKARRIGWMRHAELVRKLRNTYKILSRISAQITTWKAYAYIGERCGNGS